MATGVVWRVRYTNRHKMALYCTLYYPLAKVLRCEGVVGPAHVPPGQIHLLGHAERLRPAEGALQDLPADGMRLAQHHGPLLPLSALCLS